MFKHGEIQKLEVAKAHIETAALMIGVGGDTRSIHVLLMAGEELIYSFTRATGGTLKFDLDQRIRPERRREWLAAKNKAYNFFKHADRDAEVDYSGPSEEQLATLNQLTIVFAVANLPALGIKLAPHVDWVWRAAIVAMPSLIDWDQLPDMDRDRVTKAAETISSSSVRQAILAQAFATDAVLTSDVELALQAKHVMSK